MQRRTSLYRSFCRFNQGAVYIVQLINDPAGRAAQFPAHVYGAKRAREVAHAFACDVRQRGWAAAYADCPAE
jgi:hypothetical protein